MKTEESRKPVPLEADLAAVLLNWQRECAYNQPEDYVFASTKKRASSPCGRTVRWRTTSNLQQNDVVFRSEYLGISYAIVSPLFSKRTEKT